MPNIQQVSSLQKLQQKMCPTGERKRMEERLSVLTVRHWAINDWRGVLIRAFSNHIDSFTSIITIMVIIAVFAISVLIRISVDVVRGQIDCFHFIWLNLILCLQIDWLVNLIGRCGSYSIFVIFMEIVINHITIITLK